MTAPTHDVEIRARLLGAPEPNTPEWYALRRSGITATDLPKILGLSSYGNARSVWHDKRSELPDDGELSEAGRWGNLLEDVVAQEWARRNRVTVHRVGVLAALSERWEVASCDRLIGGRNAALEVKTRSAYVAGKWRTDVPDDVLAQVAWQRRVGRFDYVDIACLLGGQQLTEFRYEKDTDLEDLLAEKAFSVWEKVQTGEPPAVDMDGVLLRLLNSLYPDRAGIREVDAAEASRLLMAYADASGMVRAGELAKEAAKAAIVSAMGEHEMLTYDGAPVFTYREQGKSTISIKDLEDNDVELFEKVLSGGHITTTTSRVLRTGKGSKNDDLATS